MRAAYWTPTGVMRWYSSKPGERVLQQRMERDGHADIWKEVPLVIEQKETSHASNQQATSNEDSQEAERKHPEPSEVSG